MFKNTKAFSSFSVDNLEKAKKFYGDLLQLEITEVREMPLIQLHISGSNETIVYEKSDHTPATFTILNFPVSDIEKTVEELKKLGVTFESYDYPGLKTDEDNISRENGSHVAWFKDPAGNILSVMESEF